MVHAGKGIEQDPNKVKDLLERPRPVTAEEVASVLGAAGYYQKFVQDYARIVKPIRQVQHECTHKKQADQMGRGTGEGILRAEGDDGFGTHTNEAEIRWETIPMPDRLQQRWHGLRDSTIRR